MKIGNDFHREDLSCLNSVNTLYIYVIIFKTPYLVVYPGFIIMGILSSAVSITRYRVEGKIEGSVTEMVARGLKKNTIPDIDEDAVEKRMGEKDGALLVEGVVPWGRPWRRRGSPRGTNWPLSTESP